MIKVYRALYNILDQRERKLALYVLLLTTVVAVIEVLGVASIMPFMTIVTNPGIVNTNPVLSFLYTRMGFVSVEGFMFFIGVGVLIVLVGSALLKALVVWAQVHYASMRNYSLSSRLVAGYLRQPYTWFLGRNSSNLAASILEEVSRVVNGSLYPLMRLISNVLIAILLLSLLIYIDPLLAISILLVLGISYGAILKFAGRRLAAQGLVSRDSHRERLKAVNEAFGGIKDVKITGLEQSFNDKYRQPANRMAIASISAKLWSEMPSFAVQGLVFGGMMVIMLYLMKTRDGFDGAAPVLALYALGAYKLMPALQEIYKQLVEIKYHQSALDAIYTDIQLINSMAGPDIDEDEADQRGLSESIELRGISFTYPGVNRVSLEVQELVIPKNHTVGFVGGSGAGKTTAVDVILGLLEPQQGGIYVDGRRIESGEIRAWQRNIGYVPQQIFLSDDSVAANIAFGLKKQDIDHDAVRKAAEIANLHNFIATEMPDGYDTVVGERGIRLSGGQRQRIGIARAVYHDPDVLILDEATSALDNITEKVIMEAVKKLGHKKTIIIVAHRLTTVKYSDELFLFEGGRVIASGSYQELIDANANFRDMASKS